MRTALLSGLALACLVGTALAQPAPAGSPAAPAPMPADGAAAAPPPPPGGPLDHRPPPPPPPSRAAHFVVQTGDRRLDVKCADDEPMKGCADVVSGLLDRLGIVAPKP